MGKWIAVLACLITVMVLVLERGASHEPTQPERVVEQDPRPAPCERYGPAVDDAMGSLRPKRDSDPHLPAVGGARSGEFWAMAGAPEMSWSCSGRRLTVSVRGPWVPGADDIAGALEMVVDRLRKGGVEPAPDAIEVVLEADLLDTVAYFDAEAEAGVEEDADAEADAVANAATDADGSATKTAARRAERKRRARTRNRERPPARPHAKGISSDDPLGDLVPPL